MTITLKSNIDNLLIDIQKDGLKSTELISLTDVIQNLLGETIPAEIYSASMIDPADPTAELKTFLANSTITFIYKKDGKNYPIHHSWVEKLNNKPLSLLNGDASKSIVPLTEKTLYDRTTNTLIAADSISLCIECGTHLVNEEDKSNAICKSCFEKKYFNIKSASFLPTFEFFGKQKGHFNKTNPIWYGIELEYGLHTKFPMAKLISQHKTELYLKSDGSIRGGNHHAEMVSHPASFTHLMDKNSWVSKLDSLDAEDKPLNNGCHIHISRTAFKNNKHYTKFKFLIQENDKLLEVVGGRPLTSFCDKKVSKKFMHACDVANVGGAKYSTVNECHRATIELRFMASSNKPEQVKRYLQFIDSMIKYTAYHHQSASYEAYFAYVTKYKKIYPYIYETLEANPSVIYGEVTTKKPVFKEIPLQNATQKDILNTHYIVITNAPNDRHNGKHTITDNFDICYDVENDSIRQAFGFDLSPNTQVICGIQK